MLAFRVSGFGFRVQGFGFRHRRHGRHLDMCVVIGSFCEANRKAHTPLVSVQSL